MIKPPFKLKIFLSILLGISANLVANQRSYCFSKPLVEFKAGYFFFSNSTMRKIYDKGGLDIQLCGSYSLRSFSDRWDLALYAAVEYWSRSGKSLNEGQGTSLWSIPVNIGLKPIYAVTPSIDYYFAIGPRYFYIHQHNNSSYVYKNQSGSDLGFFVNTGFNCLVYNHFVIDVFGEYSYAKMDFYNGNSSIYTKNMQVGGFTFGGGLGYEF
jgi:hypothetical protein